jgi:hypothetical protein
MSTELTGAKPETATRRTASTAWIPRVVRCARCEELAREEARERLTDDEIAVRYSCTACRWHQTRHYYEEEG